MTGGGRTIKEEKELNKINKIKKREIEEIITGNDEREMNVAIKQ